VGATGLPYGKERILSFEGDFKMWRAKERRGYCHLKEIARCGELRKGGDTVL
jgi:hypothetical protein